MVQENSLKYNSIIILGPTACGKTGLSVALAKALNTEIIGADSMQIYKDLDIGTAKVTNDEKQGIKHHMIDIVDATASYSVAEYRDTALNIAKGIIDSGKIPVIVGGTGFYLMSLIKQQNYASATGDEKIRNKYQSLLEEKGKEYIYSILQQIDKESANKLHYNDTKRVIRALEIYETTGKTKSQLNNEDRCENTFLRPLIVGLNLSERQKLYDKINLRVDVMFEQGLEKEVKSLYDRGLNEEFQSMQGIGYKEFFDYFKGKITLEDVKEQIKLNTRHYAKRQLTYFNQFENINWYYTDTTDTNDIVDDIIKKVT